MGGRGWAWGGGLTRNNQTFPAITSQTLGVQCCGIERGNTQRDIGRSLWAAKTQPLPEVMGHQEEFDKG